MAYTFKHGDRPLDDFTIQRAVGRGGFGEVYYAISDGGREVALKFLRDNPQVELRGTSHCINLKSPHLVTIFDVKKNAEGEYFIVMEYVSGPSLRDLLVAEPQGLGPQKAAFFIREIAKGLGYLHDRGIVHRDLKPGNIFYEEGYVKIGDYGLSKSISVSRHSAQTASVGTVHYMAPEVGSGNYHRGIDIYAMGVILYEMLLGKVPFEGSSMGEVLMKHLTAQPEVDDLPQPFGKVIRKALQKDPADRYQSIYEMAQDLLEVEDVRTSLAGFNPASLSAAVARKAPDAAPSPAPSPNPAPPPAGPVNVPRPAFDMDARRMPAKMEKRLVRTSEKIEQQLRKLETKHGPSIHVAKKPKRGEAVPPVHPNRIESKGDALQRMVLAALMVLALGVAVGFIADGGRNPELMIGSITTILGMVVGLVAGCKLVSKISRGRQQPKWISKVCMTVATGIPLFACGTPIIAHQEDAGALTCLALLASVLIINWKKRVVTGSRGELSIGQAIGAGFVGLILTAIFTSDARYGDRFIPIGAGAAAASSLMMQALAWFFPLRQWLDGVPAKLVASPHRAQSAAAIQTETQPDEMETLSYHQTPPADEYVAPANPVESPSKPDSDRVRMSHFVHRAPGVPRSILTRIVGALAGMGILAVCIGIGAALMNMRPAAHGRQVHVEQVVQMTLALTGLFGLMLFSFRKTSRYRTGGFYRDTLRPLLLILPNLAFAWVIVIKIMEKRGHSVISGQLSVAVRVVLVAAVLLLVVLLCKRGQRYPRHRLNMPADPPPDDDYQSTENPTQPVNAS